MDRYDLEARHAPVVFAVLPLMVAAFDVIPGLGNAKVAAGGLACIVVAAIPLVATRLARSAGRARQDRLFATWDGIPSTAMLRIRDVRVNLNTKLVYRRRLSRLGPDFQIPTEADEATDPARADILLTAAMDEIRRRVKKKGIKAVHRENINFGASRNLYGLKPFGLGACVIAWAILPACIWLTTGHVTPGDVISAAVILVTSCVWLFAVTASSVKQHAEAYCLALFEAIEEVVPKSKKASST